MARYLGSVCKLCRTEGAKLFLKAERCNSYKCAMEKKPYSPGQHGTLKKFKKSEYGIQLREKQKTKKIYGILEKQFLKYFKMAEKQNGMTGENLLIFIESRLDNFIVKSNLVKSKKMARQMIVHGHFLVNGKRVDRPSFLIKQDDVVRVADKSKEILYFKNLKENEKSTQLVIPDWIKTDMENLEAKVLRAPNRGDITTPINEHFIVELYSK